MSPYLRALARFRNKIDFEISKQRNAVSFDFILLNYAKGNLTDEDLIELRGYYKGLKVAREMLYRTIAESKEMDGKIMADNHFADVGKKDTMSLNLALIILDRLNTTERIDVSRDSLAEAVQVVTAATKYRIPQKAKPDLFYYEYGECPTCGVFSDKSKNYCSNCGQALDWSD